MARFTVDTQIFRELGELLVGRNSTALVELIKNSYDADATSVTVYGEALRDSELGFIRVTDNGNGMTPGQFQEGFLKIASRSKAQGPRFSSRFGRRFTGAKGIGRLAAHKLARVLQVSSVPISLKDNGSRQGVEARIDWDSIERLSTLDDLEGSDAIFVRPYDVTVNIDNGTEITLNRLRRPWTPQELGRFLSELQTFQPASLLTDPLPTSVIKEHLLFEHPTVRERDDSDQGFDVLLEGDFDGGEEYWNAVAESVNWVIEIDTDRSEEKINFVIAPTRRTLKANPAAETQRISINHPDPQNGPFFQARIMHREGQFGPGGTIRQWARQSAGIRVFMEGFRVLPYGESGNDWLRLDEDYTRRTRTIGRLELDLFGESDDPDEGLLISPNANYYGAIFLTERGAPSLRLLVNREGFIPEASLDNLFTIVRSAIDFATRTRAALRRPERRKRRELRSESGDPTKTVEPSKPLSEALRERIRTTASRAQEAAEMIEQGNIPKARERLKATIEGIDSIQGSAEDFISEGAMLRVLASVGTNMAAFIHEINILVGMSQSLDSAFERLRQGPELSKSLKSDFGLLHRALGDLQRSLERQAAFLTDVITPDARRRRSRQKFIDRFRSGVNLVAREAQKKSVKIINEIPSNLRSPPMFPAELTTVFSNLLTNAVKAAEDNGQILATGSRHEDGTIILRIENTGVVVDPSEGERWFRPFESTTVTVDPILGQGMGLGLPITRSILEDYGAEIRFTSAGPAYATAIEIRFPGSG